MAAHTIYAHNNQLTIIKIISKTWFSGPQSSGSWNHQKQQFLTLRWLTCCEYDDHNNTHNNDTTWLRLLTLLVTTRPPWSNFNLVSRGKNSAVWLPSNLSFKFQHFWLNIKSSKQCLPFRRFTSLREGDELLLSAHCCRNIFHHWTFSIGFLLLTQFTVNPASN